MKLSFDIQGGDKLSRSLQIAAKWIKDYKKFFDDSLDIVEKNTDNNFKTQGSSTNEWRWKNLSSDTERARKNRSWHYRKQPSNPWVLRWTWQLQDGKDRRVGRTVASLEYTTPYAKYHQFGYWVPKRKFLEFNQTVNQEITRALQTHIDNVLWIANLR